MASMCICLVKAMHQWETCLEEKVPILQKWQVWDFRYPEFYHYHGSLYTLLSRWKSHCQGNRRWNIQNYGEAWRDCREEIRWPIKSVSCFRSFRCQSINARYDDTILNLGLNDEVVVGLAKLTNNERFAYDSYRRFIQMFSDVVMEVEKSKFEAILDAVKEENNCENDCDLSAEN